MIRDLIQMGIYPRMGKVINSVPVPNFYSPLLYKKKEENREFSSKRMKIIESYFFFR